MARVPRQPVDTLNLKSCIEYALFPGRMTWSVRLGTGSMLAIRGASAGATFGEPPVVASRNCFDNAAAEIFLATLKSEYFQLARVADVDHLRKGISEYIHYCDHDYIKLKLKGSSPVQYRTQFLAA